MRTRSFGRISVGLDTFVLIFSLAICAALFGSGGAEALAGAVGGALIGRRQAASDDQVRGAVSGAFAGLFAGALFTGFLHGALAALF
jgi:hypothetical protein